MDEIQVKQCQSHSVEPSHRLIRLGEDALQSGKIEHPSIGMQTDRNERLDSFSGDGGGDATAATCSFR